jgi:hypothetical protein
VTHFGEHFDMTKVAEFIVKEGECFLRTKHEHLKAYHIKIIGTELYFYKPNNLSEHKIMHCLIGAFIT